MNNIMRVDTYDGTPESAQDLIKRLYIENCHSFNTKDNCITNHRDGILYQPGDSYQYAIHEEFRVFGNQKPIGSKNNE